jgi:hypothetical protein
MAALPLRSSRYGTRRVGLTKSSTLSYGYVLTVFAPDYFGRYGIVKSKIAGSDVLQVNITGAELKSRPSAT